jgi:Icc-related predicted phosphoesterase
MLIHFFSDIHLEFGPLEPPITEADVVVAAGDIGIRNGAIEWLAEFKQPVIYVAGNHEFWGGDLFGVYDDLRNACQQHGIHFLEQDQVTIEDVTFYGCTLWTDFTGINPGNLELCRIQMNDFEFVSLDGRRLEPEDLARYNHESVNWLKKVLSRKYESRQVVVTHHAPSFKSWGFDPSDPMRYAYCNELDNLIRNRNVGLWIHGHTHCSSNYSILNTRVVCNARGYYPNRLVESFEPERLIEIYGKNTL